MEDIEENIRSITRDIEVEKEAKDRYKKRLEAIRSDISLFETTLEIKVFLRQEEEIRRIEERKESLVDSINFFLEAQKAKPNNDLRNELEESNHKLEAENAMSKNQEKMLSKRIQALEE